MKPISQLENLCGPGKPLSHEPPDVNEYAGLLKSGMARLADASNLALSLESRFDLAYNAAHALSLAALRKQGYRSSNRYIVFQALQHTLDLGPEIWRVLAKSHDVRNMSEYEGLLNISQGLVNDLIEAAHKVAFALEKQ
ncbi:MAG: hypothetical protein PHW66_01680 [Gallionella sp.]|nr:hypothetical protein [Gallionella sp.]